MYRLAVLLISYLFILTACSNPAAGDISTLEIGITPNLKPIGEEIYRCASGLPVHFLLLERPLNALSMEDYDAILHVGDPPTDAGFTTQIGSVKLFIILNPENPVPSLDSNLMRNILMGSMTDWQDVSPGDFSSSTPIQVWSYPEEDDVRSLLETILLNGRSMSPSSRLVPDGQAMIDAVKADPFAIGFITELTAQDGVRFVYTEPSDVFSQPQPILASLSSEAGGEIALLLACLAEPGN
jgi:hypothetical protein